jgi:hypothetical protein
MDIIDTAVCKTFVRRSDFGSEERAAAYTFLLCARRLARSIPPSQRWQPSILTLQRLPHDVVQHIAQLAYQPRYVPEFELYADQSWTADLLQLQSMNCQLSNLAVTKVSFDGAEARDFLSLSRPIFKSRVHLAIDVSNVWYGTNVTLEYANQQMQVRLWKDNGTGKDEVALVVDGHAHTISAFDNSYEWCQQSTFAFLVDMVSGCVTICFNEIHGPCVRLRGDWKRTGVTVHVLRFPAAETLRHPAIGASSMQVAVSSLPWSATFIPKSLDEHVLEGSLSSGNAGMADALLSEFEELKDERSAQLGERASPEGVA